MRRLLVCLVCAVSAVNAWAQEEKPSSKVTEFIEECLSQGDYQKRQKLVIALKKEKGAVEGLIAAACAREELGEKGWMIASAAQPIFESRRREAIEPLRKLLKEKNEAKVRFGITLVDQAGLVVAMAEDLIALFPRMEGGIGGSAMSVFSSCRDPQTMELLIKEASGEGERADHALSALTYSGSMTARPFLRKVALDPKASINRRVTALNGLNRFATPEDLDVAVKLFQSGDESMISAALGVLIEARAVLPVEVLRAGRNGLTQNWNNDAIQKLLSLAGDEEGAKVCLSRARSGNAWEKGEWYRWAGRSGLKKLLPELDKAFESETDDQVRMEILQAIGDMGDPASIDLIARYLTHPEQSYPAVKALCSLTRRTPESLDGVLDRLVDLTGISQGGVDTFYYNWLERATPADRVRLVDAYLRLLERTQDRPRIRAVVVQCLSEMTRPDFGQSEESVEKWKAWWGENRAAFEKGPPKSQ